MPDYLSRLVGRTFGLITIAKPVPSYIFSPELSLKNGHIPGLAVDNESVIDQEDMGIDSSRNTKIISEHKGQPPFNRKKPLYEDEKRLLDQIQDRDSQSNFTSLSRMNHNISPSIIKPLKQNDSGFQEQIESVTLDQLNEQDNQYQYISLVEPVQNKELLYRNDSDTLESVEHKLFFTKEFHRDKQDSREKMNPIVSSEEKPSSKTLRREISDSIQISERSSSLKSSVPILENNKSISRTDFYPPEYLNLKLKQSSILKAHSAAEHIASMLVERQNAFGSLSTSTSPTIKVTIGRIEVRAERPPLEPQPQTLPQKQYPILSLDDYLKQHNG